MVQRHTSTPQQYLQWSAEMIAHAGEYGLVTRLARLGSLAFSVRQGSGRQSC